MIAERERKKNIPKVLVEIRMAHYEEKRKKKIRLIKEVSAEQSSYLPLIL
jgi:hypothetical protein